MPSREEILAMAKEAGDPECVPNEPDSTGYFYMHITELERFAALVYAAGARDMQERAAKIAAYCVYKVDGDKVYSAYAPVAAAAIRNLEVK